MVRNEGENRGNPKPKNPTNYESTEPADAREVVEYGAISAVLDRALEKITSGRDSEGLQKYQRKVVKRIQAELLANIADTKIIKAAYDAFNRYRVIGPTESKAGILLAHIGSHYQTVTSSELPEDREHAAEENLVPVMAAVFGIPLSDNDLVPAEAASGRQAMTINDGSRLTPKERKALQSSERAQRELESRRDMRGERILDMIGLFQKIEKMSDQMKDDSLTAEQNEKLRTFAAVVTKRMRRQLRAQFTEIAKADKLTLTDREAYVVYRKNMGTWSEADEATWGELPETEQDSTIQSVRPELLRIKDNKDYVSGFRENYLNTMDKLDLALTKMDNDASIKSIGGKSKVVRYDLFHADGVHTAAQHIIDFFKYKYLGGPKDKVKGGVNFVQTVGAYFGATWPTTLKGIDGALKFEEQAETESGRGREDIEQQAPEDVRDNAERLKNLALMSQGDLSRIYSSYVTPISHSVTHKEHPYVSSHFKAVLLALSRELAKDRGDIRAKLKTRVRELKHGPQDTEVRHNTLVAESVYKNTLASNLRIASDINDLVFTIDALQPNTTATSLDLRKRVEIDRAWDSIIGTEGETVRIYDHSIENAIQKLNDKATELNVTYRFRSDLQNLQKLIDTDYKFQSTIQKIKLRLEEAKSKRDVTFEPAESVDVEKRLDVLTFWLDTYYTRLLKVRTETVAETQRFAQKLDAYERTLSPAEQKSVTQTNTNKEVEDALQAAKGTIEQMRKTVSESDEQVQNIEGVARNIVELLKTDLSKDEILDVLRDSGFLTNSDDLNDGSDNK